MSGHVLMHLRSSRSWGGRFWRRLLPAAADWPPWRPRSKHAYALVVPRPWRRRLSEQILAIQQPWATGSARISTALWAQL